MRSVKPRREWTPKAAGPEMLKRMMSSTISMAGIYALGENEGENVGEIMLNKLKAMPKGALAGAIFGRLASFGRFSKLHPATGCGHSCRYHERRPGPSPRYASVGRAGSCREKVYGYGLNAWFTRPSTAMSPRDIQIKMEMDSRVSKAMAEADAVDKEMAQDGLQPVAKETLKKAVREHATKLGKESTPAPVLPTKEGQSVLINKIKEGTPEQKAKSLEANAKVEKAVGKAKIIFKDIEGDKAADVPVNPVEGQTEKQSQASELQDMLLKMSDTLAEPGKISAAKKRPNCRNCCGKFRMP
ncbi:MAG: hypothetical protein MZV70_36210 [Desulfobacterales bacterium]|nr:hypothetical protein [Desulfobacterales bacterium]